MTARLEPAPAPPGLLWRRLGRQRALVALVEAARKKSRGLRVARAYAFGVFLSYALVIVLMRGPDSRATTQGFVRAALEALSWVVGALAAFGTAQALAERERGGVDVLAAQRGFSRAALLGAYFVAAARRITLLVGVPGWALLIVALLSGQALAWAALTAFGIAIYALLLGASLAALALVSAELAPRHARPLLAGLVLVPLLLAKLYPGTPNLPEVFGALLERALKLGVGPQ